MPRKAGPNATTRAPGRPRKEPEPVEEKTVAVAEPQGSDETTAEEAEKWEPEQEPKSGDQWFPGDKIPRGMQVIRLDDGTSELALKAPRRAGLPFDADLTEKTLKRVDEAYRRTKPTEEVPDKPVPSRLLVNEHFWEIINSTRTWGDEQIPVVVTKNREKLSGDGPQFKFIVDGTTKSEIPYATED
jgi:hypothetical protein